MIFGKDHRHPRLSCPACGYRCDTSSQISPDGELSGHAPADGSASICLACATINIYCNDATSLRPPTVEERGELTQNAHVQGVVQALLKVKDGRRNWPKGEQR